jgi:putative ABC transport system permease protein
MLKLTLKNLAARKFRLVLTSIAVILGVAFMAGTFVLTDTLGNVFDDLFANTTKGVDAVVRAREPFKGQGQAAGPTRPPVPEALAGDVQQVRGVECAQGNVFEYALIIGKDGKAVQNQAPTFGTGWYPRCPKGPAVNQSFAFQHGHGPKGPKQVAIDLKTANDGGFKIGDDVTITFQTVPPQKFRLVGTFEFGGKEDGLAGATLAAFTPRRAQEVTGLTGKWDSIEVRGDPDLSEEEVRDAIRVRLPELRRALHTPPLESLTGQQLADEQASDIKDNLSFFNTFLLVFAIVALFVGAFIIYNTFSITVAQRLRELGLMRALGASGQQVVFSVALEAILVGLFSSIVGLLLGIAIVKPLEGLLSAFGVDLPTGPLQILPRTIIASLVVGTVVTFVSAIAPARRAAKVPPIAALRDQAISVSSGRRRYVWGGVATALGLIALGYGLFGGLEGSNAAIVVGIAAALVFIGVSMLSPLLARPAAIVLTWPSVKLKSVTGNLARQNVMRNPRRTASTAAALMIGLALVSLIAIVGESSKATFASAIDDQTKTDFILSPTNFAPFSAEAASAVRLALRKQFGSGGSVVEWRSGTAEIAGSANEVLGVTPNFRNVSDVPLKGKLDVAAMRQGGVVISDNAASDKSCVESEDVNATKVACRIGRFLPMQFPTSTELVAVPVAGIYTNDKALGSNTDYLLGFDPSTDQWQQRFTNALDSFVFVRKPAGASTAEVQKIVKQVAHRVGGIEAENKAEFKDRQLGQFNQILGLVYVLLLLAVIIALIGIVNTLALSIYERTREIGLLRAVGMSRVQLKRMVRGEAVVVAVFGSLLGLVIGIVFGAAIIQALSSEGIIFTLPVGLLVVFVVLSGLAGLLAGSPPARRAAHLDVLRAVSTE